MAGGKHRKVLHSSWQGLPRHLSQGFGQKEATGFIHPSHLVHERVHLAGQRLHCLSLGGTPQLLQRRSQLLLQHGKGGQGEQGVRRGMGTTPAA